jgi:hypothetical protein
LSDKKKTIRIQNDGEPSHMTKVIDVETGTLLPHVLSVDISISVGQMYPLATLVMSQPEIDVTVQAAIEHMCPHCGHIEVEAEEK